MVARLEKKIISIVPGGTEVSFRFISQHFVLGYFPWVPYGTDSAQMRRSYVEAHWRLRDGAGPRSLPDIILTTMFYLIK
jgi:hypothetical protein